MLAPLFSWLWIRLGSKEPSSPIKFAWGLLFVGFGMLLLVLPSQSIALQPGLKVSPNWLIFTYMFHTIGELCLSPVGLSTTTKLAPARYSGIMMGLFFFAIGAGNLLAGLVVPFSEKLAPTTLFFGLFLVTIAMAIVLVILTPRIKKMMAGVR
jgi:POT family proton-dependent oligopeptide transporter